MHHKLMMQMDVVKDILEHNLWHNTNNIYAIHDCLLPYVVPRLYQSMRMYVVWKGMLAIFRIIRESKMDHTPWFPYQWAYCILLYMYFCTHTYHDHCPIARRCRLLHLMRGLENPRYTVIVQNVAKKLYKCSLYRFWVECMRTILWVYHR